VIGNLIDVGLLRVPYEANGLLPKLLRIWWPCLSHCGLLSGALMPLTLRCPPKRGKSTFARPICLADAFLGPWVADYLPCHRRPDQQGPSSGEAPRPGTEPPSQRQVGKRTQKVVFDSLAVRKRTGFLTRQATGTVARTRQGLRRASSFLKTTSSVSWTVCVPQRARRKLAGHWRRPPGRQAVQWAASFSGWTARK
jgi:hypothetical protein